MSSEGCSLFLGSCVVCALSEFEGTASFDERDRNPHQRLETADLRLGDGRWDVSLICGSVSSVASSRSTVVLSSTEFGRDISLLRR